MELHVVVTTQSDGESEVFCDVVQITDDEGRATLVTKALRNLSDGIEDAKKELKGLGIDADNLVPYENAAYFKRELNGRF